MLLLLLLLLQRWRLGRVQRRRRGLLGLRADGGWPRGRLALRHRLVAASACRRGQPGAPRWSHGADARARQGATLRPRHRTAVLVLVGGSRLWWRLVRKLAERVLLGLLVTRWMQQLRTVLLRLLLLERLPLPARHLATTATAAATGRGDDGGQDGRVVAGLPLCCVEARHRVVQHGLGLVQREAHRGRAGRRRGWRWGWCWNWGCWVAVGVAAASGHLQPAHRQARWTRLGPGARCCSLRNSTTHAGCTVRACLQCSPAEMAPPGASAPPPPAPHPCTPHRTSSRPHRTSQPPHVPPHHALYGSVTAPRGCCLTSQPLRAGHHRRRRWRQPSLQVTRWGSSWRCSAKRRQR